MKNCKYTKDQQQLQPLNQENGGCLPETYFVFGGNIHLVPEELSQVHDSHSSRTSEESHAVLLQRNMREVRDGFNRRGPDCTAGD